MSTSIPPDLRRFGIRQLLIATTTVAISVTLDRFDNWIPNGFTIASAVFWLAMGGMVLSDCLDPQGVNERTGFSFILNSISLVILPVAMIAWMGMLFVLLCGFWISLLESIAS
ncbi:MAG: hypothetical protein VXZ82_02345 [Planctomycetota bacterium]|nr:hypothetical protein [Planctomycetota bacterium]